MGRNEREDRKRVREEIWIQPFTATCTLVQCPRNIISACTLMPEIEVIYEIIAGVVAVTMLEEIYDGTSKEFSVGVKKAEELVTVEQVKLLVNKL